MSRKVSYCAVFVALAMIFSYIEVIIPFNFGIPGIKLGLANLVIVLGLYFLKPKEVLMISMVRILLMSILFGNGVSLLYSLAGGISSFIAMVLLHKSNQFSFITISITGAVMHNVGQLLAAIWVLQNTKIFYYFPVLLIAGVITGSLIGILAMKIVPVVSKGFMKVS